jgi:hypothetical protein
MAFDWDGSDFPSNQVFSAPPGRFLAGNLRPPSAFPSTEDDAKMRRFSLGILSIIHVENVLEIERSFLVIFWLINSSISV